MNDASDLVLELLTRLFPSERAAPDWSGFVGELSDALDGAVCTVWSESPHGDPLAVSHPEMVPLFRNYAQHPETDLDFLDEAVFPLGRPVMSPLRRSSDASFGREVLEPANLSTEGLLLPLASSGALISSMLSIYCRKGFALERDGLELIRALTPWLLHAAQATTVLRHTESQMDGLRRSLDRFSVGVILLDDNAQIVFANRRAASLLERRHAPLFSGADDSAERCAALQEDVTIGTVRTRLKQVFAKTGTSRQASLVRLLLTENAQSLKPASGG